MTISIKRLFAPMQIPATPGLIYAPTTSTRIDKLTISNPSQTTLGVATVYWVPSGSGASTLNEIACYRTLQPTDSFDVWPFIGHVLAANDAIWAFATGATLNIFGSGTQVA